MAEEAAFTLTGMAIIAGTAALCGLFMLWLRQPAMVGFIFAGTLLGPTGFGFIEDPKTVQPLAEIGVLLLLFVIGLEISLRALKPVLVKVMACAVLQSATALGMTSCIGILLG